MHNVVGYWTCRGQQLNTQHVLILVDTSIQFNVGGVQQIRCDTSSLKDSGVQRTFLSACTDAARTDYQTCTLDEAAADVEQAFQQAVCTLPEKE